MVSYTYVHRIVMPRSAPLEGSNVALLHSIMSGESVGSSTLTANESIVENMRTVHTVDP